MLLYVGELTKKAFWRGLGFDADMAESLMWS